MTGSADEQLREELIPACEGEPDDELATHETTVLLRQRAPPRFNVYIFVISLATLIPLSTLGSLVDVITARFSSKEYELVIGLLFLSAFPMAYLQLVFDRGFDLQFRSSKTFVVRMAVSCAALCLASLALSFEHDRQQLLAWTVVIGVATWVANGATLALAGMLPSSSFVWQGAGFQLATLCAFSVVYASRGRWAATWITVACAPLVGLVASVSFLRDPYILERLAAKDEAGSFFSSLHEKPHAKVPLPRDVFHMAIVLLLNMFGSIVASGTYTYFKQHGASRRFCGVALSEALYLCFSTANVVSRPVVALIDARRRPSVRFVRAGSYARFAATSLLFSAAFSPTEWAAWLIVSIYTLYALVGGCFTTWTFKIARDSCSDPDEACEASRTMVLSQNAGLSLAGLFNCVFALSYGSAR